ncbi:hypothetical protein T552_01097 [Pneumocystis carinii B80]|uniref:Uncharacterized protein n=1 Tax=Pneumocystis carinii (strain B80) TaxID=1408658 RepID=A0A0W4ZNJ4_PNEC8|nr:hypothetical protein T552_01097 [Pneumocystis carinii B80]KTW29894.1 hypothetical protein T552_01097 [Pneumocystis carinii B80]
MKNIQFYIPPLSLGDEINKIRLDLTACYTVFYPDKNAISSWKKYDIIKGDDLNLKLTVLWKNKDINYEFINGLGHFISSAELWKQLHLRPIIIQSINKENDITLNLLPSKSYPILHYPISVLHGELSEIQIHMNFKDLLYEEIHSKNIPNLENLTPLIDLAFRSLCLDRISKRSTCTSLKGKLHSLKKISSQDSCFLTQELWNTVKKTIFIKKSITEFKPTLNPTYTQKSLQKNMDINHSTSLSFFSMNNNDNISCENILETNLLPIHFNSEVNCRNLLSYPTIIKQKENKSETYDPSCNQFNYNKNINKNISNKIETIILSDS